MLVKYTAASLLSPLIENKEGADPRTRHATIPTAWLKNPDGAWAVPARPLKIAASSQKRVLQTTRKERLAK